MSKDSAYTEEGSRTLSGYGSDQDEDSGLSPDSYFSSTSIFNLSRKLQWLTCYFAFASIYSPWFHALWLSHLPARPSWCTEYQWEWLWRRLWRYRLPECGLFLQWGRWRRCRLQVRPRSPFTLSSSDFLFSFSMYLPSKVREERFMEADERDSAPSPSVIAADAASTSHSPSPDKVQERSNTGLPIDWNEEFQVYFFI